MTGGELQLKAYGSENIYLNGNPQISFFRCVYKRHTNFAMENYRINFDGTSSMTMNSNTLFTFNIKRYGDLLGPIYFVVKLPTIYSNKDQEFRWIKNLGANLIVNATLYIAGQKICEMHGDTINNYHRLTKNYPTNLNYNECIGHTPEFYDPMIFDPKTGLPVYHYSEKYTNPSIVGASLYIPIPFFFSNNSGNYLPLIALQRSEVQITVETRKLCELYTLREDRPTKALYGKRIKPDPNLEFQSINYFLSPEGLKTGFQVNLDAQFIFLDNEERQQFVSRPHEYLIEQVQYKSYNGVVNQRIIDMSFFHPTKEMRFYFRKTDNMVNFNEWSNFGNNDSYGERFLDGKISSFKYRSELEINDIRQQLSLNVPQSSLQILDEAKFLMNGQDRTRDFPERYWRIQQTYQYHIGSTVYPFFENDDFYVFSYSIEPDVYQPSGSCNLTNLKSYQLRINTRLPPLKRQFIIAYYVLNITNQPWSTSFRDPRYTNVLISNQCNITINNVYKCYLAINSLQENVLYGNYEAQGVIYNIKIFPIQYGVAPNGTIINNRFILDGSTIQFYNRDDIYYQNVIYTYSVVCGEIVFIYLEKPITINTLLDFTNQVYTNNIYNNYLANISNEIYISLTQSLGSNYVEVYKTIDNIVEEEIFRQFSNTSKNTAKFSLNTVDTFNKILYGTLLLNGVLYNSITNYQTSLIIGIYTVIPLNNNLSRLYLASDIQFIDPVYNGVLLPNSILIYHTTEVNNTNPDDLQNYLWRYDLMIEAHNYNLLRIVNGEGSVAFST